MENENQQTPQQHFHQTVVIVDKQKSVGIAFILAFLFGPLGLLYASVIGGIIMFIVGIIVGIITFGFGLIFIWIGCIIWAIIATNNANKKMANISDINIKSNISNSTIQPPKESETIKLKPEIQLANSQSEVNQLKSENSDLTSKSINSYGNWVLANKKGLLISAGSILALAILFVSVKFILSADFNNNNYTGGLSAPIESGSNQNIIQKDEVAMMESQFIIDTYLGTIGEKEFKLFIEKIDGENVEGYNVTGTNKRPVKGRIVNKWTKPTGLGGTYTIFKLILTEPGDDKWDGEFNIDLWISDQDRTGTGTWKSYNGQLVRDIKIKDRTH